jgi:hypothetical protein
MTTLRGHALVFNVRSLELGGFVEQIAPSFVERTLRERLDVRALVAHDPLRPMGRLSANTLRLRADSRGLLAEIDPPDTTSARDALESINRGDAPGWSFAFRTLEDRWTMDGNTPLRTLLDGKIREVSCACTWPAYPATEAAGRYARVGYAEAGTGITDREWAQAFAERFRALVRECPGLEARVDYRGATPKYRRIFPGERRPYRPSLAMRRRQLLVASL